MLNWIVIDEDYAAYLRDHVDSRVPRTDYGDDHYKPFFGVLFEEGDYAYVGQISHPKERHYAMPSAPDFEKIYQGTRLISIINLNFMFPVPKNRIEYLDYNRIGEYRSFTSETEKNKYIALMRREMTEMRRSNLENKAQRLYQIVTSFPSSRLAGRCLDFKALEAACKTYYQIQ